MISPSPRTSGDNDVFSTLALSVDSDASGRVSAVNVKLPPFWPSDSDVWFVRLYIKFVVLQLMGSDWCSASAPSRPSCLLRHSTDKGEDNWIALECCVL